MLAALSEWLDRTFPSAGAGVSTGAWTGAAAHSDEALRLATAVLLVEVMRADGELQASERAAVEAALLEKFELKEHQLAPLRQAAEEAARQATDFYTFTSSINQRLNAAQKLRIVELMWQVAYADGRLSAHERHVLWRVADLLHVPQADYVNARLRAEQQAAASPSKGS
jgi:uncharacterized tellurite resistance protein B-like protein